MIAFVVYGSPAPAGSKTPGRTKDGRLFVRDSSGKRGGDWRRQVAQTAGETMSGADLLEGPLAIVVVFYSPRPKGHYGARGVKESAPPYPMVAPDATKLLRAVEDALEGICYRNDAAIVHQVVDKRYGEPARAEIRLWQFEEPE